MKMRVTKAKFFYTHSHTHTHSHFRDSGVKHLQLRENGKLMEMAYKKKQKKTGEHEVEHNAYT